MSLETGIDLTSEEKKKVVTLEKGKLQRLLGVPALFAVAYGDIGSSIYYALGVTVLWAMGAAPVAFLIAGLFFIFTVLTYTELATAIPESGGAQIFARRAFGDIASFLAGWAILLDYLLTATISAYTVGPYLSFFFPLLKTVPQMNLFFTTGILTFLILINIAGIRESSRLSIILTFIDLAVAIIIVLVGLFLLPDFGKVWHQIEWGVKPTWSHLVYGVSIAMVNYIGIEVTAQLAGEAREPGRQIPRAMGMTLITVLVMTLALSIIAVTAVSPEILASQYLEDALVGVAEHIPVVGPYLKPVVAFLGAAILLVAANAGIIGASRVSYSMGSHYQLPGLFNILHSRLKTPYVSLLIFGGISIIIVWLAREIKVLADLYAFGAMLTFALAHLSLIGLRIREPDLERPFKIRGNFRIAGREIPITAILGFLATFGVWIIVIITHEHGRNLGLLWMMAGAGLFVWYRRKKHLPVSRTPEIERLPVPEFKSLTLKKILVPTLGGASTETVQHAARLAREHDALLVALYVIEIPAALPLDTFFADKLASADAALERAQAIASEYGVVNVETHVVQSREAGAAIVEMARDGKFDMVILGIKSQAGKGSLTFGRTVDHVLRNSPCRVWLCTN